MKNPKLVKGAIAVLVIGLALGYLMYEAMRSSWKYYYSVDEFAARQAEVGQFKLRLAGRVKPGSVDRDLEKAQLSFVLAGSHAELPVVYAKGVPDNFDEGKEVLVDGRVDAQGRFAAEKLMTQCESKYKAKLDDE